MEKGLTFSFPITETITTIRIVAVAVAAVVVPRQFLSVHWMRNTDASK